MTHNYETTFVTIDLLFQELLPSVQNSFSGLSRDAKQWRSSAPKSGGGAQTFFQKSEKQKKKKKKGSPRRLSA